MLKNFKPVNLILVVGAMALPVSAYADLVPEKLDVSISLQSGKVTGVVEDNFGPVAGASVVVKGTTNGTITDMNGNFSLEGVNNGDLIQISFIGYMTQELIYKGQAISVKLAEDTQKLDEVVVTALGMKRSEKSLGYAMKEIKGDELNANLINPVAALQGKVAGLEISGSDGGMFGSSKVQIRSASTLGKNNQPIYVIDGVILDNSIKEGNPDWDSNPNDYGNELKNLNPDDFESVSVLKGAAATALYGSRGLNGAIVITTKSGKSGQGLGINISQSFGMDVITQTPSFQNEFGNGIIAGNVDYGDKNANGDYYIYDNFGQYPTNANGQFSLMNDQGMSWGPAFDGREIQYYDGSTRAYSPVKNNFHKAYQKGFSSNTNVAISGGNEKTTFYTSLSYRHVDGTTPNNSFDRISFLGKASHMFHPKIKLEASMSFANSMPKNSPINIGENFASGVWGRSYDPSTAKDKYKGVHGGLASSSYGDEYGNMPGICTWWSVYENDYRQKEISVRPVVKLNIDLLDWLKFNVKGSYNYYYTRFENKQPGSGYANEGGYYGIGQTTKEQTNLNANFMFNKTFGDFTVNGFLHGEFYENFQQAQSMNTNGGLIAPNQYFIENSKQTPTYGAKVEDRKKMLSVAFQVGVNWKDQIFLDVTGRNDWSSTLVYADGHGSYSYFYPSVNGSWLISSTYRDQLPEWISFAKIRGSWAQVGNDTSPYIINTAYQINTSTLNGTNYYGMSLPGTMYDQDLKPERKNAWEIGLDWRFLNNRIGLDATYYKENTKDQIMEISVPAVSGITKQLINAGNIQNKGVELALNTIPFQNQDWEWTLDFTWTKNMNKIVELHENVADYITLAGDVAYGNYRIGSVAKVGASYGTLMTDSYYKFDKSSGLPMLVWTDGTRRSHYLRNEAKIVEIGSMIPDFLGSISTGLKYKNWSLNISLDMRFGGKVASYNSRYGTAYGFMEESLKGTPGHGGVTWTSKFDGKTYNDGIIPQGIIPQGTQITQPDGSIYTVGAGGVSSAGQSYQELFDKGVIEPTHASAWTYRNNAWTMAGRDYGVVNNSWVEDLNYIALCDISLSYRLPSTACEKIKAKHCVLTLNGHNLGYLLNSLPNNINPESVSGTAAAEFRIRSLTGVTSSFTFTVNVGF